MTLPSCVFPGTCPNLSGPLTDYSTASRAWGKDQCKNWASCVHITMAQAPHGPGCLIQNLLCLCSSISASGSPQWELGSALPGFLGTSSRCSGLRPGPGMSEPCLPQAGPQKQSRRHTRSHPAWTLPVLPGAGVGRGPASWGFWSQVPSGWLRTHGRAPRNAGSSSFSPRPLPCAPSRERLQVTHLPGTSQGPWAAGQEHGGRPSWEERREAPGLGGLGAACGHPAAKWET